MQHYYRELDPVESNAVRFDTDPRIVITAEDSQAVASGSDYTPTDLMLIKGDRHPYFVVAP